MLEARVKHLEESIKEALGDLKNVRERLSKIEGQLLDMPTKDWMNTRMLAYFGAAVAVIGLMIKFL